MVGFMTGFGYRGLSVGGVSDIRFSDTSMDWEVKESKVLKSG